ncbi:MAG: ISLre2 family transposase [Firmicutes bacterium]|nr:ISLre2 family transposase [Bacillota bacterium]
MYNSILQLALDLAKKIWERAESGEYSELDIMADEVLGDCKRTAADMIQEIITHLNQDIRKDKAFRKEEGFVLKEKDRPRVLLTSLGQINFRRDYYYDKEEGRHRTILDLILGIEKYERVAAAVDAELVNQAADCSYAKAAQIVTSGAVSRQTVRNQLLKANIPEMQPKEEGREVSELHIYADEDHVHMQKPGKEKGKESRIVPLVTVTEGTGPVSRTRNQTINPMHFTNEELDPKKLWKSVEGYIEKAYDVESITSIYIHGDGGSWIRNALEDFRQTKHVVDGFHFYRELKSVAKILPKRNVRVALINALKKDDRGRAETYIEELLRSEIEENEYDRICKFKTYLLGSWTRIRRRVVEDIPGSCTEGQISHVMSKRLSRDPIGWGDEALGKMACMRVYRENGGKLTKQNMRHESVNERYSRYAEQFAEEHLRGAVDFSIFEKEEPIMNGASATQILLGKLGRARDLLA